MLFLTQIGCEFLYYGFASEVRDSLINLMNFVGPYPVPGISSFPDPCNPIGIQMYIDPCTNLRENYEECVVRVSSSIGHFCKLQWPGLSMNLSAELFSADQGFFRTLPWCGRCESK